MRAVVQRVSRACVTVSGEEVGRIGLGLLAYVGVARDDSAEDGAFLARKLVGLRVFPDVWATGKMTRSVLDVAGAILIVSQFTLFGDLRRGLRPSFDGAEEPEKAEVRLRALCDEISALSVPVATGRFRAMMEVSATVDGPVTILVDSRKAF